MPTGSININLMEPRMLKKTDAAAYVCLPQNLFLALCPCTPIEIQNGKRLWDRRDLDKWIDGVKTGTVISTTNEILAKLS